MKLLRLPVEQAIHTGQFLLLIKPASSIPAVFVKDGYQHIREEARGVCFHNNNLKPAVVRLSLLSIFRSVKKYHDKVERIKDWKRALKGRGESKGGAARG